jgi:hypothetical protein
MKKWGNRSNVPGIYCLTLGMSVAGSWLPTQAAANTVFTWDPAGASPSLNAPAFTADAIQGDHYLYSLGPVVNPNPTSYDVNFIEPITGFTLNGSPVATPGLNGAPGAVPYGLYVDMHLQTLSVGPNTSPAFQYLGGTMSLMLDPGYNNGALSSTTAGLLFANGTGGDITLATGSLVSGTYRFSPAPGIRSIGDFVETLRPAAGEEGFFLSPASAHDLLEEILTVPVAGTANGGFTLAPDPADPTLRYSLVNGALLTAANGGVPSAAIGLQVPEPGSFLLLGGGLMGFAALRQRRHFRRPH